MNNAIPLYDWSTCNPDGEQIRLQGRIEANTHPVKRRAGRILTSRVVEVNGRIIRTRSGTLYRLENIAPEFLKWLGDNGYDYDAENPIGHGAGSRLRT